MLLCDLIAYAIRVSNTTYTECAAALGISKQNFGQRLRRDSFDLEEAQTIFDTCGVDFEASITFGGDTFSI